MTLAAPTSPGRGGATPQSLAERVYWVMLRVLPARFRAGAAPEMLVVFRDWRAAARSQPFGRVRVWWLASVDLFACLRAEISRPGLPIPHLQDRASMFETLLKDFRYALRGLRRAPAFTLIVVLTLALGIGANTAIFSVVDGIMLRSLPFEEPDDLVAVWADYTRRDGPAREWLAYPNFHDLRQLDDVFEEVGTYLGWGPTLTGVGEPVNLSGAQVSEGTFNRILRVQPALGRGFAASDDVPEAEAVALLSWSLWQSQWNGDPSILGRSILLDDLPVVVIGVMPANFQPPFAPGAALWTTLRMDGSQHAGSRGSAMYRSVARLAPGVPLETAQSAADTLGQTLETEFAQANTGVGYTINPLREDIVGSTGTSLWILLGAVGFVLLMACVNVANLLLAQASGRVGELAVRSAIGASRTALVRQLLAESLVLATTGGLLGALLGFWGTRGLVALAPPGTPRIEGVATDARVLAFTAVATIAAAFVFGLLPALRASRGNLAGALNEAGRSADGSGGRQLRAGLVVLQVALAMVLLVGAGLMLRTFQQLNAVDMGFESAGVLAVQLGLPSARYEDGAARMAFYAELERRLTALPGVDHAGGISSLPLGGNDGDANFQIDGQPEPPPDQERVAWIRQMTAGYPAAIGLRLIDGRFPDPTDDAEATPVVAINETLARRFFGDTDPVGQRIYFGRLGGNPTYRTIVGVIGDIKNFGLAQESRNAIYFPFTQLPTGFMSMVLRTSGDPSLLAASARATVAEMDPLLAARTISTMDTVVAQSLAPERFTTLLMTAFALVALTLAVVGLYGVVSYAVSLRSHEMGVRMALGAGGGDIGRIIVGSSVGLIAVGLLLGVAGAWGAGRAMTGLLYGVEATDPMTFAGVIAILLLAGIMAALLPARRASRIDPVRVLGRD
jgi:putative ABC transport system permease protein